VTVEIIGALEEIAVHHDHTHGQGLVHQVVAKGLKVISIAKSRQLVLERKLLGALCHRDVMRRHDDRFQSTLLIAALWNNLQRIPRTSAISYLGIQVRHALHTVLKRAYIY